MRPLVVLLASLVLTTPCQAKFKNFQRSYRGSRTLAIRHGKRPLRIMPDNVHSAYREHRFYLLPTKEHGKAYKGLQDIYVWDRALHQHVTFVDRSMQRSPQGLAVNGAREKEIDLGPPRTILWENHRWTWPKGSHGPIYAPRLYHQARDARSQPKPSDWSQRRR